MIEEWKTIWEKEGRQSEELQLISVKDSTGWRGYFIVSCPYRRTQKMPLRSRLSSLKAT
jgi:hypothetical protein